jgi:predicted nucleotidyltransferase component of viral defense system
MHREVLTKRAAELYWSLSLFSGFYLAGGTALALQIGHRISVDFDLFSDQDIERSLLPRVQRVFSDAASIAPLINNSDELTVLVDDVKITFLKYPFPTFDPFVIYDDVPLLSVREIAATKAYTIGRRGAFKDYIDLYFILSEQHVTAPVSGAARISRRRGRY